MRIPRKVALLGATSVLLVLALPASSALSYSASERRAEKRQNNRVKKVAKALTTLKNQLGSLPAELAKIGPIDDRLKALEGSDLDGRLKVIEGAAPALIQGLTDLKTAAEALNAGLEKLQTLGTATEYGIGQVFIGASPAPGAFVVTPDIPDAVQQAQTTQTFIAGSSGTITVQVAVRSAESDGTGASDPAAHCRVTVAVPGSPHTRTSSPNPALGNAPFWSINTKSKQTSTEAANQGFPFGPKTSGADADVFTDLTAAGNSTAPTATDPAATAGTPYQVTLSCLDTSASTTDPSA